MEGRISGLVDAGLLSLGEAKARYIRARELRGLQIDSHRQKREAELGQLTLYFNLTDCPPNAFQAWVDQQKEQGVFVSEQFEFGTLTIKSGRYAIINEKGWSLPDSDPRWKVEVTYAWTGPVDAREGVNFKAELDLHVGDWDQSGHCWWIDGYDDSNLPDEFDPEVAADEHAAWVADQPVRSGNEFEWSMV